MTNVVEDRAALTELYLKSTKPVADKDFEGQFNVQHLAKQFNEMLLYLTEL